MRETLQESNGAAHRSTRELIQHVIGDIQDIIRSEMRLAKAELKDEGAKARKAGTYFAIAGLLGLYAVGFFLVMCVALLALMMPLWIALLIVGFISACAAGICVMAGAQRWRQVHPVPEQTVTTLKEDIEWVRKRTKSENTLRPSATS